MAISLSKVGVGTDLSVAEKPGCFAELEPADEDLAEFPETRVGAEVISGSSGLIERAICCPETKSNAETSKPRLITIEPNALKAPKASKAPMA